VKKLGSSHPELLIEEPANRILTAVKKAEDDASVVVRFHTAEGCPAHANLRLFQFLIKEGCLKNVETPDPSLLRRGLGWLPGMLTLPPPTPPPAEEGSDFSSALPDRDALRNFE
jgi:hypothetical protein